MLAKRHCPYTGIVNYFDDLEPFIAIGCIAAIDGSRTYVWRSHIGNEEGGRSTDLAVAEAQLKRLLRSAVDASGTFAPHQQRTERVRVAGV